LNDSKVGAQIKDKNLDFNIVYWQLLAVVEMTTLFVPEAIKALFLNGR